jgi:2-polyprenyl-3-methyl-5-hydroxy-6-metoxy-1,4-benzoquinol methylase
MKRAYWEKMAPSYNEEIFDVLQQDKKALIRKAINKYAHPTHRVIDIGCAIGKWIPVLSPLFKKVTALDISAENLRIAQETYPQFSNVSYQRGDMSNPRLRLTKYEMGICINAILTPDPKDRVRFFKNLASCIRKEGILIVTVPSLESFLLSKIVQKEFNIDSSLFPSLTNAKKGLDNWNKILRGVGDIDDVPHKHFMGEELQLLLDRSGFSTLQLKKIEYSWETEFNHPPRWLKTPRPWDWMLVAQRR